MAAAPTGYTERIKNLRDQVITAKPTICTERARIYTEVYRTRPEMPIITRRARALARTLSEMSIFIEDGALIVGNQASRLRAAPIFPEYAVEWIRNEIDQFEERPGDRFYPSDEAKRELLEICDFWQGRTTLERIAEICRHIAKATPDGRNAGKPLAEGASPAGGTDVSGPTAVFSSVAKLPTEKILGGVLLNQKVTPSILRSSKEKLSALLRTFFGELKGWHVQYNCVDADTLRAAQNDPESYRDLVVRVAGYSAFFNTLSPETQNDIIGRTEQEV